MAERPLRGLFLNDYDLTRIGFTLENEIQGWRNGLTVRDRTTQLPGRVGTVALARTFETEGRMLTLTGMQKANSLAILLPWYRELKQRAQEGTVEVRFIDDQDKVYYARAENVEVIGQPPSLQHPANRVRLSFLCPDPLIYDRNGSVAGFSAAAGEIPLGTANVFPIIRINGAVTNPVITYKDFRGDTIATFGLTAVIASGEWREIDMNLSKVTDESGVNQISEWSSGSFFALDSQDSAGEDGPYGTLEISPTADCDVLYRKSYL